MGWSPGRINAIHDDTSPGAPDARALAQKVAFLSDPAAYSPTPSGVRAIETHMAFVFLAGDFAYKIKKPVRYPFLDFSTPEKRKRTCHEEVRLNRRLARDVYLGVVALTLSPEGALEIGGGGPPVDWLIKMRRLPEQLMLDRAIRAASVSRPRIEALGDALCAFYRGARPVHLARGIYARRFLAEHETNRKVIRDPAFAGETEAFSGVLDAVSGFLGERADLIEERASSGRIRDGHGDLRPEHVCLLTPPVVIDCLEFNRELRLVDPFDELVFFGLECELLGAAWIGEQLVRQCADGLEDHPPGELMAFYRAYRALLRARLSLAHLKEPGPRDPEKWMPLALRYLELARRASLMLHPR